MNEKGFAVSGVLYTLLLIALTLFVTMLFDLKGKKSVLDKLTEETQDKVANRVDVPYMTSSITQLDDIKDKIVSIKFLKNNLVPSDSYVSYDLTDVTKSEIGSVMAWLIDNKDDTYNLYIGGIGGVRISGNASMMFNGYSNLQIVNMAALDTSDVSSMNGFFKDDINLEYVILGNFNTSYVSETSEMFSGCTSLKTLNLTSFNTKKVINMDRMFYGTTSLEHIYVSSDFVLAPSTNEMFLNSGVDSVTYVDE